MTLLLGIALFIVTILTATLIGMKANQNVRDFKEDEHEIFVGQDSNH